MDSPTLTLSRSTSTSAFAPGSHRRSHPNLQHLSLAPLTPKYPIDPADYDAYFDPTTSELHTSTSISHISSLPSPGGILSSNSRRGNDSAGATPIAGRSRANSRNRNGREKIKKRRDKSGVSIRLPQNEDGPDEEDSHQSGLQPPSGALSSEGFGHKDRTSSTIRLPRNDSSWFVQTGLALTESSRETKGQSWIGKRDSSTSLHASGLEDRNYRLNAGSTPGPGPNRSRPSSRKRSRRNLTMTPAASSGVTPSVETITPDWADQATQAEIAAQVQDDFADEMDEDDPYGMLNFEEQFDTEDEDEVRKEITSYGLAKWMDGVVDVFLQLDEEFPEPNTLERGSGEMEMDALRPTKSAPGRMLKGRKTAGFAMGDDAVSDNDDGEVEPPPAGPRGLWDDVAWFGRMVVRTVRS